MKTKLDAMSFEEYYEARLRPLETPEFAGWFNSWYRIPSGLKFEGELKREYLKERQFALIGWIAGRANAHEMGDVEFVNKCLRPELARALEEPISD